MLPHATPSARTPRPSLPRGFHVVDLRPKRRERALPGTAALVRDSRNLPAEAATNVRVRPKATAPPPEILAPERPSDKPGDEPVSPSFPLGLTWEITEQHAARWRQHNFAHRRGDTNHFRSLGDLSESEFALLLWDLSCWKGMVRRAGTVVVPSFDAEGRSVDPYLPSVDREGAAMTASLVVRFGEPEFMGQPPPPLEEYLRPGRENWGEIGRLLVEWGFGGLDDG